jgi:transcriptional regulator with XRE-family HTH domain
MSNEYMSRQSVSAPRHQTLSADQPADLGLLLASRIRNRREELGLPIERAARLAGLEISQWHALEAGWVLDLESGLLEAVAGTLEVSFPCVLFIADVSSAFQPLPV